MSNLNPVSVYLRKSLKIAVDPKEKTAQCKALVLTINKNLESLGFTFSRGLILALSKKTKTELSELYTKLVDELRAQKGDHVEFEPMYPNFPEQVLEMESMELYWNAFYHYVTLKDPNEQEKIARLPLDESEGNLTIIKLGSNKDYEKILTSLTAANSSLSASDKEVLVHLVDTLPNWEKLIAPVIPQRETRALLAATILTNDPKANISHYVDTATDVLRLATALSGGDISLAENTKYKKFSRPLRRQLLELIETKSGSSLGEDMLRNPSKWIRLGEILHPGQYPRFPRTLEVFTKLRKNVPIETFNSKAEKELKEKTDWKQTCKVLSERPGDFLRRLDHTLRTFPENSPKIVEAFLKVSGDCATPALLNVMSHFKNRQDASNRIIFPKNESAKAHVLEPTPGEIPKAVCKKIEEGIEKTLTNRFSAHRSMGKVYVDPALENYPVPSAQRSASKTLRSLPRGSHAPIQGEGDTLRFFIHWKNMEKESSYDNGRVDLDLSASFLDKNFREIGSVTFYNLREFGGTHSGDIVDAPEGASEFIDVDITKMKARGIAYVIPVVKSYTRQPYADLPECFCGWMKRKDPQRGEIFDARTVETKSDLCGAGTINLPVMIDLENNQAIWIDLNLKAHPDFCNTLEDNQLNVSKICREVRDMTRKKVTLATLLKMHVKARGGELVEDRKEAKIVFDQSFAYENDEITSKFLENAPKIEKIPKKVKDKNLSPEI